MNSLYRTMFFVPGNDPKKIIGAEIYRPDCIIYDLEDSVSIFEKDSARILVKYALQYNRPDCRVGIRINQADSPYYEDDVSSMVPLQPDFLRLPKAETAEDIKKLDVLITEIEEKHAIEIGAVKIVASIETALGVVNSYKIASASKRMLAIGLGAEDFRTDMRMERSEDASEILFARNLISLNAHATGIMAMDYVYSNIKNRVFSPLFISSTAFFCSTLSSKPKVSCFLTKYSSKEAIIFLFFSSFLLLKNSKILFSA